MRFTLTIRAKIYLLCTIYSLAGLATAALLSYRAAAASERDHAAMEAQFQSADMTRQMQLAFKKQVQEWKDVLLRWAARRGPAPAGRTTQPPLLHIERR